MELILRGIQLITGFHMQLLVAAFIFCSVLKPRLNLVTISALVLVYACIPFLFPQSYFWDGFRIGEWFTFGFILVMLLSMIVTWISFEISSLKELLFYGVAAIILQHVAHSTAQIIYLITTLHTNFDRSLLDLCVTIIVYGIAYVTLVKRLKNENVIGLRNIYLLFFTSSSIFIVFWLSLWTTMTESQTVGSYAFDLFSCILLLILHFGMFEWGKMERQNESMKQILYLERERHAIATENVELLNMKFHDLKYQIALLKNESLKEDNSEYFEEIEKALSIYEMTAKTENSALDVLISEKSLIFEKHKINFTCVVDGAQLEFMTLTDVYSLFGNALDNAVEAILKIDDKEKRIISLKVISKGNYVIVNISNYFENEIQLNDGLPITTKDNNDYHGFGIKSIRYIAEKYGGTISINIEKDIFKLNIIIPKKINN